MSKWKMSIEQLAKNQQHLISFGLKEGLIKIKNDRIYYTIQKKSYKFDDPEEPIRAATYIKLVKKYEYLPEKIDFEVYPPRREPKLPADIVVFEDKNHEKAFIVVECKADSSEGSIQVAKREGLGNANLLNAQYLLLVCGEEELAYDLKGHPSSWKVLEKFRISQIPIKYRQPPKYRYKKGGDVFSELRKADLNELRTKFKRCHDAIWEGGKRDPAEAFSEMSKLMFSKIYDERFTKVGEYYKFQVGSGELPEIVAKRVKDLYKEAQKKEPNVFNEELKVDDGVIFEVVKVLQDISLIHTDLDSKGRAYEEFLGKVFRGELGQFFTPREVIEFMVKFVDPRYDDIVMDPACGSGGFLLYSIRHIAEKAKREFGSDERTIERIVWDFSHQNVFGIEVNERIARVAMMDMVIHDDGHTNIECQDALMPYSRFDPRKGINKEKYDLVLTNPPFGAIEKREEILKLFELGKGRKEQKKEILFIERCLDLLRPSGIVGIIVPDGILANPTLKYVRDWIERKAKIIAVISLPPETFIPFGSFQKASILFLQKKKDDNDVQPKETFMAMVEYVGYDSTGKPTKHNDLEEVVIKRWEMFLDGKLKPPKIKLLKLSKILEEFPIDEEEKGFIVSFDELKNAKRWDVEHFRPKIKDLIYTLEAAKCPKLKDLVNVYRDKASEQDLQEETLKYIEKIDGKSGELVFNEGTIHEIPKGARFKFRKDTLVVSRINAKIGCIAIVPEQLDGILGTNEYYGLEIKDPSEVLIEYLHEILRSEIVKQQIIARTSGLYSRINEKELLELRVPLPPIKVQEKIKQAKKEAYELRLKAMKREQEALIKVVKNVENNLNH
jgi:type I restriction enzyme M protein